MRKLLPALLLGVLMTAVPIATTSALDTRLPELGTSAGKVITPKAEKELGQAFMRSVRRNQAVLDDPLVNAYVQELGDMLLRNSEALGRHFHFFVIDNPEINAFAGPGGYIGVYTGLILTTETESELAAVLAHEIAHVTQQHLLRAWETANNLSVPSAAVLLTAIALGVVAGGDAGIAAASAGQAALIQEQINFTRANEQEADRIGIDILSQSRLDANAMPSFFSRMSQANRVYASNLPEFLRTHPVTTNRIADALGRASSHPYSAPRDDLRYQLLKVRLQLLDERLPRISISEQQRLLSEGRYQNELAAKYRLALLLSEAERFAEADRVLAELLTARPGTAEFIISKIEVEKHLGRHDVALSRLQTALQSHPGNHALNLAFAKLAIGQKKYDLARTQLGRYLAYAPEDPQLYALLARVSGESGDVLSAHLYQAEHHYLGGGLDEAILQLEIAAKLPGLGFYDSSRVESRLEQLRREKNIARERE